MKTTEQSFIQFCLERFQNVLCEYSKTFPAKTDLGKAMRYSLSAGGKRIRPLLVYASGEISRASWEKRDIAALSVEMMHTYSLIHDDLPCMDNAALRRNHPTCHRQFNEHTAVLAGDALQLQSIELLTHAGAHALRMIQALSKACGSHGMILGQALDMDPETSPSALEKTHLLKTGALFSACLQMGYLCGDQPIDETILKTLAEIGKTMGIAFQIQDDLLDVIQTEAELGKTKCDQQQGKFTYVTMLGVEGAKQECTRKYDELQGLLNTISGTEELVKIVTELYHRHA